MNNYKIVCFFPLLAVIFMSCQAQEQKFVDLGKLTSNFNVSSFFEKKLQQTKETLAKDPEKVDKETALKLLNNPFFAKDTLGFFKTDGRLPTDLSLGSINDWMNRNNKPTEIFGYEYNTVAYNEERDSLAILNSIVFPKINMAEDKKGNLMYVEVSKTSKTPTDFSKISAFFEKTCKTITVEDAEPNASYWENENFFYILTKKEAKEEEILSYDLKGNKNSKWVDVTEIDLYIYQKSYVKKMEAMNIYSSGKIFWNKESK